MASESVSLRKAHEYLVKISIASDKYPDAAILIDDEDFERVKGYVWNLLRVKGRSERGKPLTYEYAQAHPGLLLHRFVMKAKPGQVVKPINGNALDCRKSNLRIGTYTQANASRRKRRGKVKSAYYGVYFDSSKQNAAKPWRAKVQVNGRDIKKRFATEKAAARYYNELAKEHFGEFAVLNSVEP